MLWLLVCPVTFKVWVFKTLGDASDGAIAFNKESRDHPAYRLYRYDGGSSEPEYVGRLNRKAGQDFIPHDCWRKP